MTDLDKAGWNYFFSDTGYANVLRDRLSDKVEMDSAIALADYLNKCMEGDIDILDIGSGPGHYYPVIKKRYQTGAVSYHGIDIHEENISFGTEYFKDDENCSLEVGNALKTESWPQDKNCVVSANTLPHIPSIEPVFKYLANSSGAKYFIFRMLIGNECVQIKKHLVKDSFENLFDDNYQYNNIYTVDYIRHLLGDQWDVEAFEDKFEQDRIKQHDLPMTKETPFYGNRVSRSVSGMVFKGDVYMPWKFVFGKKK